MFAALLALALTHPVNVCDLIQQGDKYDGLKVTVAGDLSASMEATLLSDASCGGIYVSWSPDGSTKMKAFAQAAFDVVSGQRTEPVAVRLEGIFHSHVPHGESTIRQLQLERVLRVKKHPSSK